jgi:hypothetical protein
MRRLIAVAAVLLAAATLALAAATNTWTGYVTDTHCGNKGAVAEHTAGCVEKCMKSGSKAQILNDPDGTIYDLDGFDKVKPLMGHKVTVTGKLDPKTNVIKVETASKAE